jgi:hypothetical protein
MYSFKVENNKIIATVPVKEIKENTKKKLEDYLNNCPIVVNPVTIRSKAQNSLIHVLIDQYALELGWIPEKMKIYFKEKFSNAYDIEDFETSKADSETANKFISFIIDHALSDNINLYIYNKHDKTFRNILEIDEVANRYVIACLKTKKCVICNSDADLEHWDNVNQIGGYKYDDGLKGRFISLCRKHHNEKHNTSREEFEKKYHLKGIYLNEKLVLELKKVYPGHFKAFKEGRNAATENNR